MRIKGYDIYGIQEQSYTRDRESRVNREPSESKATVDPEIIRSFQDRLSEQKELISSSEKQFFKELFPDSSQQIDSHVVFNRSGRIQSNNVRKGVILDTVV